MTWIKFPMKLKELLKIVKYKIIYNSQQNLWLKVTWYKKLKTTFNNYQYNKIMSSLNNRFKKMWIKLKWHMDFQTVC